jgi:uncharacterized membrane protein YccC
MVKVLKKTGGEGGRPVLRVVTVEPQLVFCRARKMADDMQHLRLNLLRDLKAVFNMAKAYAKSKDKDAAGKLVVSAKQKQIWVRIMTYTAQVMNSLSKSYDDAQVTSDLKRLESMINEAMAKEKDPGAK